MRHHPLVLWMAAGIVAATVGALQAQDLKKATPQVGAQNEARYIGHKEEAKMPYVPSPRDTHRESPGGYFVTGRYIAIQANVNANGNNIVGDAANEPSIAVSLTDPWNMVIGWRQFDTISSDFRQAGWGYTTDGGAHWTFPGVIDPGWFRSDPVVDARTDGVFCYNSLTNNPDYFCKVFKSVDGGATWDAGVDAWGGDKQWQVIDTTNGPGQNHIYASWNQSFSVCGGHFTRSINGGLSFEACTTAPGSPYWGTLAVGPAGELYLSGDGFLVDRSNDAQNTGPITWTSATVNLGGSMGFSQGPNPGGLLGQVNVCVDRSSGPTHGYVYALCSVDPTGADPMDVMFSRSTNGGVTWSAPIRVNDVQTGWQWFGTMSVAPNGRIDAVWNDTRNAGGTYMTQLFYSHSSDGGVTWTPNEVLTPAWDPQIGWPQQNKIGDYYDMTSDDMGADLAFSATLNGEQDVYYMRLGVRCSSAGTVQLDRGNYGCEDAAVVQVNDCDLNLNSNQIETIQIPVASNSEPTGELITLTETAPQSALFAGTVILSQTNSAGVLLVTPGDTVTATYIDADNGQGGHNLVVTDTALIDCIPPLISNVATTNIQAHTADVTFNTNEPCAATVHYGFSCGILNQTATVGGLHTAHVVTLTGLAENSTYFYAVEATDEAGNFATDNNGGACYTFVTPDIPDYFTELFTAGFDLANLSLQFVPNGSQDFYGGCHESILTLPTDPTGGTPLALTDDSFATVTLTGGAHAYLYGTAYTTFYVGSNGYITFTSGDTNITPSFAAHFNQRRITGLMRDLNPSTGGQVSWKQLADRAVVTWLNVPCYSGCGANTFQIEMFFSGQVNINYLAIAASDGLAGLSRGTGVPSDFQPSDLSTLPLCGEHPPTAVSNIVVVPVATPATVSLVAIDDGLPNPPGVLTYIVTSLPQHGGLADPNAGPINVAPYMLTGHGNQVIYTGSAGYYGDDTFQFQADDGGVPPTGGPSNIATETLNVQFGPPVITTTALPNACLSHNYNFQMQASQGQPPLAWSIVATGSYVEADLGNNQFTATGTAQNWRNDDQSWPYTLPFTFPYYGVNRTTVNVCSNGFLDFTSGDTTYSNSDAGLIAAARIAPLWDDLLTNFNASDDIYIDATIPNQVTIRWLGVTYNGHIAVNFAVTLYADGRIQFHYGPGNTGLTPTIGISKGDGVDYVLSTYNNATALTNANSHEFSQTSPLPPNITLSAAGLLSGVPTVTGTFTPHIKVTDALNRSAEQTFTLVVDATCGLLGDVNCDGIVDFDDINPFVLALSDPIGYHNAYPNCDINNADCDGSGIVDFDDINPFVAILSGGK